MRLRHLLIITTLLWLCMIAVVPMAYAQMAIRPDTPYPQISPLVQQIAIHSSPSLTRTPAAPQAGLVQTSPAGEIGVEIRVKGSTSEAAAAIADLGVQVDQWSNDFARVGAWVRPDQLETLAALPMVIYIDPMFTPLIRTSAITTRGDSVLQADQVRAIFGLSGAGVRVGVISDGVDSLTSAQNKGELPLDCANLPSISDSCVHVAPALAGVGNEGIAMLEIIHDLAPEAILGFASGRSGVSGFIAAIDYLEQDFQADVIVDDIGYLSEPFFENGDIGTRAQAAVDAGVVYVSAAGNDAQKHYQATLDIPANCPPDTTLQCLHRFAPTDTSQSFRLARGASLTAVFQWDNRFGSAVDDLDIYLLNNSGAILAQSAADQLISQVPIEIVSYTNNTTSIQEVDVVIDAYALRSGSIPQIELLFIAPSSPEYLVSADSIYGHPGMPGVLAIGAVPASTPTLIQAFSSQGPVTISHPVPEARAKPDLVATDCVATSTLGFTTFCGTSAAAPHVAALAALFIEQEPQASPQRIHALFQQSAVDLGGSSFDSIYGAGRADGLNMLRTSAYETLQFHIQLPLILR